jgi:hypothetical protein
VALLPPVHRAARERQRRRFDPGSRGKHPGPGAVSRVHLVFPRTVRDRRDMCACATQATAPSLFNTSVSTASAVFTGPGAFVPNRRNTRVASKMTNNDPLRAAICQTTGPCAEQPRHRSFLRGPRETSRPSSRCSSQTSPYGHKPGIDNTIPSNPKRHLQ